MLVKSMNQTKGEINMLESYHEKTIFPRAFPIFKFALDQCYGCVRIE